MLAAAVLASVALALPTWAATPTPGPAFSVQFTTSKGCLETGSNPAFAPGERITFLFRVNTSATAQASASILDIPPSGGFVLIGLGAVPSNTTIAFSARVAPPPGIEQVIFRARIGSQVRQRSCSFLVTDGTAKPTRTPTPPMTPSITGTPRPTHTPTPTGGPFDVLLSTDLGCQESGDDPIYRIGTPITVSFRVDGPSAVLVYAILDDVLANGFINRFALGYFPTNRNFSFPATIGPPTGEERLELNVRVWGRTFTGTCSFRVAPPENTATRAPTRTRTPTRTRSPLPSGTPTPTATMTPTPM